MGRVRVGNRGLEVSRLRRAIEPGINFFDTADMYSADASEQEAALVEASYEPHRILGHS